MLKFPRLLSALLVVVALTAMTALAQSSTSRILGRVVDSKDAVMAGATVTVIKRVNRYHPDSNHYRVGRLRL